MLVNNFSAKPNPNFEQNLMKKNEPWVFLALLCLSPLLASAMSLKEYSDKSLRGNLSYRSAYERLQSHEALSKAAWGVWLPKVEWQMGVSQSNVGFNQPLNTLFNGSSPSNLVAFIAKQKIIDRPAFEKTKEVELEKNAEKILYEKSKQHTLLQVASVYFDVLTAQEGIEVATLYKQLTNMAYQQAIKNQSLGLTTASQVTSAEAQRQAAVSKALQAYQNHQHLLSMLNQISQCHGETLAPFNKNAHWDQPQYRTKTRWVSLALKHNLDLKASKFKLKIVQAQIKQVAGKYWPVLSAYAGYAQGQNFFPLDPGTLVLSGLTNRGNINYTGTAVGLEFKMPLFSGGEISNLIKDKYHAYKDELLQFQELAQQLHLQIEEHYDNILLLQTEVVQTNLQVKADSTELNYQKIELQQGKITPLNYLETENRLFASMMKQVMVKNNYIKNLIELYYLAGLLDLSVINKMNSWLVI